MTQSKAPFPDHGGNKRKPAAPNLLDLQNSRAQARSDRQALIERAVDLRVNAEMRLTKLRAAGIVTPDIDRPAATLLRHHDPSVRSAAHALLSAFNPRLRGRTGAATSQGCAR